MELLALRNRLFLGSLNFSVYKCTEWTPEEEKALKIVFWGHYKAILEERGSDMKINEKESKILAQVFYWCIGSAKFAGDLKKGIYLVSRQGFGKDVILSTIVRFFETFRKHFREYRFSEFNMSWYEKGDLFFNCPVKINDVSGNGKVKRERESIPFLEFLDYREQINNRRSILVSSNLLPAALQAELEEGKNIKRLEERIKECFNVFKIMDAESKRVENIIEI